MFQTFAGLGNMLAGGIMQYQGAQAQARNIINAGEIQAQGSLFTAQGFRVSAQSVRDVTAFNVQIQKNNTVKQLSAMSRQAHLTLGHNIVTNASRGISQTSKSALLIRQEAASVFEKQMLDLKINAENQRRATLFESEIRQVNLENQARGAEFQAQASRVLAANRASAVKSEGKAALFNSALKTVTKLPSIFGSLGG